MENMTLVPTNALTQILEKLDNLEVSVSSLTHRRAKELLTHKEAQQLLKCSRNTLDSYVYDGYFTRIQESKGKKILFKRSELEAFINNEKTQKRTKTLFLKSNQRVRTL